MTKLRLSITFQVEYTPEVEFYQDKTPFGMLMTDIENAKRDPMSYIELSKPKVSVSGDVIGSNVNEVMHKTICKEKCINRGKVNGLSQETFCSQCIRGDSWKKDFYDVGEQMSDIGEIFKAMKEDSKRRREKNRKAAPELLSQANIEFEVKNHGAHLIVEGRECSIDFWPGTGKWMTRNGMPGFGIKSLIKYVVG